MSQNNLIYALLLTLIFFLLVSPLLPEVKILAFAPLLILIICRSSFLASLWAAFAIGLFCDLLSSFHMGLHILTYLLTVLFIYRYRSQFDHENPINSGIFTVIFSSIFTILFTLLFFTFEKSGHLGKKWFIMDLALMPILDGLYASFWVFYPSLFIQQWEKRLKLFLLNRKRR